MFLYDKTKNFLHIYELKGNETEILKYRKNEMEKIPENERVFKAESYNSDFFHKPIFEFYLNQLDSVVIPMEEVNTSTPLSSHLLKKVKDNLSDVNVRDNLSEVNEAKALLNSYYYGYLNDCKIARVQELEKIRYFLLSEMYKVPPYGGNNLKILKNIIELPESLYLLQLIEQGKFSLIGDKDISEQLRLYSISIINEISLNELKKMDECGMTKIAYDKAIAKANNDAHILKLIKK